VKQLVRDSLVDAVTLLGPVHHNGHHWAISHSLGAAIGPPGRNQNKEEEEEESDAVKKEKILVT